MNQLVRNSRPASYHPESKALIESDGPSILFKRDEANFTKAALSGMRPHEGQ